MDIGGDRAPAWGAAAHTPTSGATPTRRDYVIANAQALPFLRAFHVSPIAEPFPVHALLTLQIWRHDGASAPTALRLPLPFAAVLADRVKARFPAPEPDPPANCVEGQPPPVPYEIEAPLEDPAFQPVQPQFSDLPKEARESPSWRSSTRRSTIRSSCIVTSGACSWHVEIRRASSALSPK